MPFEFDETAATRVDIGARSQPLSEFTATVMRYLPYVLAAAVVAGAIAFFATTPQPPTPVATAQIGLTEKVVWPFYDTARQRAITLSEQPDFIPQVQAIVGEVPVASVVASSPTNLTLVEVKARSNTAENAAIVANAAANLILQQDLERVQVNVQSEVNQAQEVLNASENRLADIDRQIQEAINTESQAEVTLSNNGSLEARNQVLAAAVQRDGLTEARNAEIRRLVDLTVDLEQAQADLENVPPELELLTQARGSGSTPRRSFVPPLAAFVAVAVAGIGVAIMYDRSQGAITSRWYAEEVAGVDVVGELSTKGWEQSTSLLLSKMLSVSSNLENSNIFAFSGLRGTPTGGWTSMLVYYLASGGYRVIEMLDESAARGLNPEHLISWEEVKRSKNRRETLKGKSRIVIPSVMTLLETPHMRPVLRDVADNCHLVLINGSIIGSPVSDRAMSLADSTIVLTRRGRNRVDQLREAVSLIQSRRHPLLGTLIVPDKLPNAEFVENHSPRIAGFGSSLDAA